jgi:hypothetical protein
LDAIFLRQDCVVHRWRQSLRDGQDAWFRHRLQAPAQGIQSRGTLLRAFYYTAIIEDQDFSSIRPLIDWLDYNGYTVVTKLPFNLRRPAASIPRKADILSVRPSVSKVLGMLRPGHR